MYYWSPKKLKELKDKGLKLSYYYSCPVCHEATKPDEWSEDRYSCIIVDRFQRGKEEPVHKGEKVRSITE